MRDKIKLVSSAGTGYYYTTTKNKRTMTEKLALKKFDPVVRKHVIFNEAKIKEFWFLKIQRSSSQDGLFLCLLVIAWA